MATYAYVAMHGLAPQPANFKNNKVENLPLTSPQKGKTVETETKKYTMASILVGQMTIQTTKKRKSTGKKVSCGKPVSPKAPQIPAKYNVLGEIPTPAEQAGAAHAVLTKKRPVISFASVLTSPIGQEARTPSPKAVEMVATVAPGPTHVADRKDQICPMPVVRKASSTSLKACVQHVEPPKISAEHTKIPLRIEGGEERIAHDKCSQTTKPEIPNEAEPLPEKCYCEHREVIRLTCEEVNVLRQRHEGMEVSRACQFIDFGAVDIPNAVFRFVHCFSAHPALLNACVQMRGHTKPTRLQSQAWPILLSGEDMICAARPGEDRVLSYLLPLLVRAAAHQNIARAEHPGPTALILAPTRDWAKYIHDVARPFASRDIEAVSICQDDVLEPVDKRLEVAICCPDHLLLLMQHNCIDISRVSHLVIDSADRMLNMGLEPHIRKIVAGIRSDRQTAIFSTTLRKHKVRALATEYSTYAVQIVMGGINLSTEHNVKQFVELIDDSTKRKEVKLYLEDARDVEKVIAFCRTRQRVEELHRDLVAAGDPCTCKHGDLSPQLERDCALTDSKVGKKEVLKSTGDSRNRKGILMSFCSQVANPPAGHGAGNSALRAAQDGRAY